MPTLNWIGKEKVTNHHLDIPYHTLDLQYTFKAANNEANNPTNHPNHTNQGSDNLIIHADNLLALKSLLPQYEGRIKCIYIDPPYNTGNEGWVYNDNVSSPRFKKWLGQVVGKEGEDLTRHDKWLCMMFPRLKLLHKLLAEDGAIFISIDDNEQASLKMIMDEIFGAGNKLGTLIWKNATDNNPTNVSIEHEFILCFAKNKSSVQSIWKSSNSPAKDILIKIGKDLTTKFKDKSTLQNEYNKWYKENKHFLSPLDRYKYIDEGGIYTGSQSVHNPGKEGYRFDVIHPITHKPCKQPLMGYRFPKSTMDDLIKNGKILFGEDHEKIIELKLYAHEYKTKLASVISLDGRLGSYELKSIFPDGKKLFDTPKTVQLIEELLSFATTDNDIILDSFAGSGTTAHAVLNLNKQDGGNRQFILIEMEDYAETITAERVKRIINGYANTEGTGGNFNYYTLGERVLDDDHHLNPNLALPKVHAYIWHTETHQAYTQQATEAGYLGKYQGSGIYFHYQPHQVTVLDDAYLVNVVESCEQYIMYADMCLLSDKLMYKHHIIFKKIPRDISKL